MKSELEGRVTRKEINGYMAFYQLEPFGEERADLRSALQLSALGRMLNNERVSMRDMMPYTEKPKTTWQQDKAFLMALAKKSKNK